MSALAHLDLPPRRRGRDLLLGLLVGAPVAVAVFGFAMPALVGVILGGARSLDSRLRAQDTFMKDLCATDLDPARDEALCSCVFQVEFPALDCQDRFRPWLVSEAARACAVPERHAASLSFCSCIEVLATPRRASDAGPGPDAPGPEAVDRCTALPDAPALRELHPLPDAMPG